MVHQEPDLSRLENAAAACQARLSAFGTPVSVPSVGAWDSERHRDVLYETRELKRTVDLKYRGVQSQRRRPREPTVKKPVKEDHPDYPVALRKYRGGFHGEPTSEKKTPEKKKLTAGKENVKKKVKKGPTIVVKDDTSAKAAVAFAKKTLKEVTDAAKRAADAAARAAENANKSVVVVQEPPPPKPPPPPMTRPEPPQYRVLPVSRPPSVPEPLPREPLPPEAPPEKVSRVGDHVLLAKPVDDLDTAVPLRPVPIQAGERAIPEATPLYFPSGSGLVSQKPRRRPDPVALHVPPVPDPKPTDVDTVDLVARMMLARP